MSSSAAGGTEGLGAGTYVPPRSMGKMIAIIVALLIVTNVITGVAVYYVAQPAVGVGTVQVIGPWAGVEWSKFKPVLDKFHNDTGIPYQYTTSRQEDLSPTLPISFQAGQSPADLIFMPSATIKQYATRNWVTELTGTLSPSSYQPGALDPLTVSGKVWGGAYTGKVKPGFWYNTSYFTAHSLQKPTTWQGFWSLLSDIKNISGGAPAILSGDTDGWPLSDATEAFIETYGGATMHKALANRTLAWVGSRADGPGGGRRSYRDRGGCSHLGLSGAGPEDRQPVDRESGPHGPGRHDRESVPGYFLERAPEPLGKSGPVAGEAHRDPGCRRNAAMSGHGGGLSRLISLFQGKASIRRWLLSQAKFLSFFLPAAILLLVLVVYPVVATLALSFLTPSGAYAGLHNYESVVGSPDTFNPTCFDQGPPCGSLINNLIWTGLHLPLTLFMGLFLAILLQNVRGASVVKSLIFLGMVTPLIVIGVVLRFILEAPIGLIPAFFGWLGLRSLAGNWLVTPSTLLLGLIFGTVWSWTGFSMIVYSAGVTTIPKDYFEAARVDGATEWQAFRKITWPLLRPITLVIVTMTVLWELKLFDIVIGATNSQGGVGGAADVLALQMYRYFFIIDYNSAAVVATLLTIFTLVVALGLFRRLLSVPGRRKRARPARVARKAEPARIGSEKPTAATEGIT